MLRVIILLAVLFSCHTAHGQSARDTVEAFKKPVLPFTGAVKFVEADDYLQCGEHERIFAQGMWREAYGVWTHHVTSSGGHGYTELEFTDGCRYVIQSGFRPHTGVDQGRGHSETEGVYRFDAENRLLFLRDENGEEIYSVDYFTARQGKQVRYREILMLTPTQKTPENVLRSNTFLR